MRSTPGAQVSPPFAQLPSRGSASPTKLQLAEIVGPPDRHVLVQAERCDVRGVRVVPVSRRQDRGVRGVAGHHLVVERGARRARRRAVGGVRRDQGVGGRQTIPPVAAGEREAARAAASRLRADARRASARSAPPSRRESPSPPERSSSSAAAAPATLPREPPPVVATTRPLVSAAALPEDVPALAPPTRASTRLLPVSSPRSRALALVLAHGATLAPSSASPAHRASRSTASPSAPHPSQLASAMHVRSATYSSAAAPRASCAKQSWAIHTASRTQRERAMYVPGARRQSSLFFRAIVASPLAGPLRALRPPVSLARAAESAGTLRAEAKTAIRPEGEGDERVSVPRDAAAR